jgi:hypothetical protein
MKNKEADEINNDVKNKRKHRITPKKQEKIIDNKSENN